MTIDPELANAILKQLDGVYPDPLHDTNAVLPEEKDQQKRELIRKTLLVLRDQHKITLREGEGGRGVSPLLFNIRLIKK